MKINIVLFWHHDDWGEYGRAYERVAEHLAKLPEIDHVVVMFPPVSSHKYGVRGPLHIRRKSKNLTLLTETDSNKVRLDRPFSRLRQLLNQVYRDRALKGYFGKLGFQADNTVLWLFPPHPYIERLLKIVPRRNVVTHVIDDFTKFDPSHELYSYAQVQYPKLGQWSDTIITTSKANQEHFSKYGKPCQMFWPAVDASFIGIPDLPPHHTSGKAPRLGYVGFIMDRTDLDLLEFTARQRPQWNFILAGPQHPTGYLDNSGLLDLANVEYLGPVPQTEVPDFLKSLDICLMPHRDNEYSQSMGPLKLYQYLASGRPIVSTNVAGLELVHEHIFIANDYKEFVKHIETALQTDTIELSTKRIALAKQNTWPVRIREIFDTVQTHLETQ